MCISWSSCGRVDSVMDSHTTGPGFNTRSVRYCLLSFQLTTTIKASYSVEHSLVCVEGWGRISRVWHKTLKWVAICIPAQRQVGPVSVYCDGAGCHVLSAALYSCVAAHWSSYHYDKQAPSRYDLRCFKATLNTNKQTKAYCVSFWISYR